MKRLADFIRDAKSGNMSLELVEWHGKTGDDIPERLRGIRRVVRQNSVALFLQSPQGTESELRYGAASLNEYDGKTFTVYHPGFRPLSDKEKKILDEWRELEAYYLRVNPTVDNFWRRKNFFKKSECPWLYGNDTVKGQRLEYVDNVPMVRTKAIKGMPVLRYNVYLHEPKAEEMKYVVCVNRTFIRDAQMFETDGFDDSELSNLDYFDCEHESRWYDRDVTPYMGIVSASDGKSACAVIAERHSIDPRVLFAIQV